MAMVCLVEPKDGGKGSGFFVQDAATRQVYVWTAAHVVEDARDVLLRIDSDGLPARQFVSRGSVVRTFKEEDLAMILVESPATLRGIRYARFAANDPTLGDFVQHVGCYLGELGSQSYGTGIVSKTSRPDGFKSGFPRIQTTVPVYPGSSGGPLFNSRGEVCGVVVSRIGSDCGFSVPVSVVQAVCLRAGIAL